MGDQSFAPTYSNNTRFCWLTIVLNLNISYTIVLTPNRIEEVIRGSVMLSVVVKVSIFYFSASNFSHFREKSSFAIFRYDINNYWSVLR